MKTNLPITQVEVPFPKGRYIVSRTDLKGLITYGNDTFFDISGFTRDEMIGKSHNMVRHPDMPPQAFEDLWRTVKAGRPWRGIVKNRCKNGDFYWVEALVVPVRKDNQTLGYMSVRTEPSRQQIVDAETLYRQLKGNQANLPQPSKWMGISLDAKLTGLIVWLLAAQVIGAGAHLLGPSISLSQASIDHVLQFLGVTSVAAGIWLLMMKTQIMTVIGRIIGRLDHIAQGDLTDGIPLDRVDELGQLNDNLVTMQTHLKAMLAEIAEAADRVGENASILTAEMDQTRDAADLQSSAVSRIASAVEELVVSVHEVTASSQVATKSIEASRGLLDEASTRMVKASRHRRTWSRPSPAPGKPCRNCSSPFLPLVGLPRPLRKSRTRPICWPSTPPSRLPEQESKGEALPSLRMRSESSREMPPRKPQRFLQASMKFSASPRLQSQAWKRPERMYPPPIPLWSRPAKVLIR